MKINIKQGNIDCLLYSVNQNCFHHSSLNEVIKDNFKNIKIGENTDDYKVVYATKTWDKDRPIIDNIKMFIRDDKCHI